MDGNNSHIGVVDNGVVVGGVGVVEGGVESARDHVNVTVVPNRMFSVNSKALTMKFVLFIFRNHLTMTKQPPSQFISLGFVEMMEKNPKRRSW